MDSLSANKQLSIIAYAHTEFVKTYLSDKYNLSPYALSCPYYLLNPYLLLSNLNIQLSFELARDLSTSLHPEPVKVDFYQDTPLLGIELDAHPWMIDFAGRTVILKEEEEIDSEGQDSGEEKKVDEEIDSEGEDSEEEKKVGKKKNITIEQTENIINWFDVALTGAREGEVLVGVSKGTKKALIKLHGPPVKPRAKDLNAVRDHAHLWKKFLIKLGALPYFKSMTLPERDAWFEKNETEKDTYIGEREGQWIELLQPGDGLLTSEDIDSVALDALMEGNPNHPQGWWKQEDIIEIIPAKTGSSARRHTLFFGLTNWKIASDYKAVDQFDGVVFDVFRGQVEKGVVASPEFKLLTVDDVPSELTQGKGKKDILTTAGGKKIGTQWVETRSQTIAFLVDEEQMVINWQSVYELITEILNEIGYTPPENTVLQETLDLVRANFVEYTAASHKSLAQKLVRFRAKNVQLMDGLGSSSANKTVSTEVVLLMSLGALVINPGSFVPDIQRYVTGLESLAKRLAVIILEDSSTDDPRKLLSLLSGALLAQRVRTWRPSRRLLKTWMLMGLDAWSRKIKYDFRIEEGLMIRPFTISVETSVLGNCSAILDTLRSFGGDLGMTRFIASHYDLATGHWPKC